MKCPLCQHPAFEVEHLRFGWCFAGACCGFAFLTDADGTVIDVVETQRTTALPKRKPLIGVARDGV